MFFINQRVLVIHIITENITNIRRIVLKLWRKEILELTARSFLHGTVDQAC
jgi:hypothetical protein